MSTLTAIADGIRQTTAPQQADLATVLQRIGEVLDRSIEGHAIAREPPRRSICRSSTSRPSPHGSMSLPPRASTSSASRPPFDLLTRPGPDLTTAERDEVKKVARDLLDRLRAILLLDWQKTALSRARVRDAIEETLDAGLPRAYTPDVFKEKTGALFDHVYRRYGTAA